MDQKSDLNQLRQQILNLGAVRSLLQEDHTDSPEKESSQNKALKGSQEVILLSTSDGKFVGIFIIIYHWLYLIS